MARRLGAELNTLKIQDNISGDEIEVYWRPPTTKERAAYANESIRRRGRKVRTRVGEARQKYGLLIMSGIREGDFEVKQDEKWVPLASDPESENYNAEWKNIVLRDAPDIVELLAAHVFDASAEVDESQGQGLTESTGEDADPT